MFNWNHKDEEFKAERLRIAYRRRVWEVLQLIEPDWTTSEDSLALTPASAKKLELGTNTPMVNALALASSDCDLQ